MDNHKKEMLGYEVAEIGSSLFDDHQYSSAKPALLPNQGRARSSFGAFFLKIKMYFNNQNLT